MLELTFASSRKRKDELHARDQVLLEQLRRNRFDISGAMSGTSASSPGGRSLQSSTRPSFLKSQTDQSQDITNDEMEELGSEQSEQRGVHYRHHDAPAMRNSESKDKGRKQSSKVLLEKRKTRDNAGPELGGRFTVGVIRCSHLSDTLRLELQELEIQTKPLSGPWREQGRGAFAGSR
ncbi:hypothetical protein HDU93_009122 [Gonapodya sp. JEL0774]|nr:hypothetical protein HDU93_009122 [Gonapodya sp. JEL0774]